MNNLQEIIATKIGMMIIANTELALVNEQLKAEVAKLTAQLAALQPSAAAPNGAVHDEGHP